MLDEIMDISNLEELMQCNSSLIELIGDCPNIEHKIFPEPLFWKTIKEQDGWECQKNIISGKVRIVSPDGIRKGHGSETAMIEKMDRLVSDSFMKPGDIIGVSRKGIYEHYAIYIGNGRVIHYCGRGNDFEGTVSIHEAPLSEFMKESDSFFVVWFDKGRRIKLQNRTTFVLGSWADIYDNTNDEYKLFSAEKTIERAKSRIGETSYNIVANNCEHFAMWCKTGESVSTQVNKFF